jgi:4-amino-4-deoxychorismate lyase
MSLLLESIYLKDGVFRNLEYHEARMRNTSTMLFGKYAINLEEFLSQVAIPTNGLFKTRVIYDTAIRNIEFVQYKPRLVQSLKLIHDNDISYAHKFLDRSHLENLFAQRGAADDILIVKSGKFNDTVYANIIFKKENRWYTPSAFLLKGTMRQSLLDTGLIEETSINVSNYNQFQSLKLINSMMGMDGPEIPISSIVT